MSAEPHLDRIGTILAVFDNLPQRHRTETLHAAAPDVDFLASMRCERIPGRHDPRSRNSRSDACYAKPPAIGISLAEIAGTARSRQRPARAGPRDWHNACGNCGNPRHGPPARYRDKCEGRAERAETHFSGPIAVRKYSWGTIGRKNCTTDVQLDIAALRQLVAMALAAADELDELAAETACQP